MASDYTSAIMTSYDEAVSIRFKVRGGFRRRPRTPTRANPQVSIRFKIRGGFRLHKTVPTAAALVSIRFKVRGGFRLVSFGITALFWFVSIRFKVRGGFRPYPLARRPYKPCCGGFTHHPSSPPPTRGQNLS